MFRARQRQPASRRPLRRLVRRAGRGAAAPPSRLRVSTQTDEWWLGRARRRPRPRAASPNVRAGRCFSLACCVRRAARWRAAVAMQRLCLGLMLRGARLALTALTPARLAAADSRFTQQELPACRPVMTPRMVRPARHAASTASRLAPTRARAAQPPRRAHARSAPLARARSSPSTSPSAASSFPSAPSASSPPSRCAPSPATLKRPETSARQLRRPASLPDASLPRRAGG